MTYKVVRKFKDKDNHVYEVGDPYPRKGKRATKARLETLSTKKNKYKKIYIIKIETPDDDKE